MAAKALARIEGPEDTGAAQGTRGGDEDAMVFVEILTNSFVCRSSCFPKMEDCERSQRAVSNLYILRFHVQTDETSLLSCFFGAVLVTSRVGEAETKEFSSSGGISPGMYARPPNLPFDRIAQSLMGEACRSMSYVGIPAPSRQKLWHGTIIQYKYKSCTTPYKSLSLLQKFVPLVLLVGIRYFPPVLHMKSR